MCSPLLLCALLRLAGEEVFILSTSSWGVSGEISILTPLLQEIFPKLQTQSCPANLSLVAAKPHTNRAPFFGMSKKICKL